MSGLMTVQEKLRKIPWKRQNWTLPKLFLSENKYSWFILKFFNHD